MKSGGTTKEIQASLQPSITSQATDAIESDAFAAVLAIERDKEIVAIHGQMLAVNQIVHEIAQLVHEQEVMVNNIHDNIRAAVKNVEQGVESLKKANEAQERRSSCKIL
jgi:t-SNARE complex subunit (syntaxin)